MPGDAVQIGPFIGGLNTYSDPTAVADNELVECQNFELDLDGSLKSRPPIVNNGVTFPLGVTGNVKELGYYFAAGDVPYLIGSDGLSSTYYFTGSGWTLITNTFAASAMAQFDDKAWLLSPVGEADPGGWWTPAGGFTGVANMPHGAVITSHKFRLWVAVGSAAVANATRLYFSNILGGAGTFWQASPDFVDIGAGDGQTLVQVTIYYNNLLIFRTNSIYSFSYTSDPTAGVISQVVPGVGLTDPDTLVAYESFLYFMYDDKAYEFINNRATQINVKVPFRSTSRSGIYKPYAVSLFNQRVIFSFWDILYVYSLRTRTWTTWKSTAWGPIGKITELATNTEFPQGIMHSSQSVALGGTRTATTLFITDTTTSDAELMTCALQTKNYSYEASSVYKRIFWWGIDAVFRGEVRGLVTPITFNYSVTWGELLAGATWGSSRDFTWSQPLSGTLAIETVRDSSGSGSTRKFVKFLMGLRFRQVFFRVSFATDGSLNTAPVRVFTIMSYVKAKERVSKAIT